MNRLPIIPLHEETTPRWLQGSPAVPVEIGPAEQLRIAEDSRRKLAFRRDALVADIQQKMERIERLSAEIDEHDELILELQDQDQNERYGDPK